MLPKENRLKLPVRWKNHPDQTVYSNLFKVLVKSFPENKKVKFGFIISTKVGKATRRNQIRRFLASFLRGNLERLNQSLELIWLVSPKASRATDEEIITSINQVLSKPPFIH